MAIFLENAALKLIRKSLKKLSEFQTRNGSYGFSPRCFRVWISSSLEDLNLRSQLPSSHTNELLCSSWRNVRKIWITCYNDPLHSRNHNITTESSVSFTTNSSWMKKEFVVLELVFWLTKPLLLHSANWALLDHTGRYDGGWLIKQMVVGSITILHGRARTVFDVDQDKAEMACSGRSRLAWAHHEFVKFIIQAS